MDFSGELVTKHIIKTMEMLRKMSLGFQYVIYWFYY